MKLFWSTPAWHLSGANTLGETLLRGLRAQGVDARLLLTGGGDCTAQPPADFPVHRIEATTWPERWEQLLGFLRTEAPCIWVSSYDFICFSVAPALPPDVRFMPVIHADEPAYYRSIRRVAAHADAVVGVSSYLANWADSLPGLAGRTRWIPTTTLPCPPREHWNCSKPLRLIYTGRLAQQQKRVLDLIAVAEALDASTVPFTLDIAGDGEDAQRLRSALNRPAVHFHGRIDPEAARVLYRDCDIFVLPSAYEGLSVSLLEAMAAGCVPVITRTRSGAEDAISDGETGLLCPIGQPSVIARSIARLHADRCLLQRLGAAAQGSICGRFDAKTVVSQWQDTLDWVAALPPRERPGRIVPHPDLSLRHQLVSRLRNRSKHLLRTLKNGGSHA